MDTEIRDRFLRRFEKENTKKTYVGNINGFYKYILEEKKKFNSDLELVKTVTVADVEDYFYKLKDEKIYKKSTINTKMEVIKEFFKYVTDSHIREFNPTDTLKKYNEEEVKEDKGDKYIPTIREIKELIKASYKKEVDGRNQEFNDARDRFLIALLSTTGMRITSEALKIKVTDIEVVDNGIMINVYGKKNNLQKRVPLCDCVIPYYEEYKIKRMIQNEKHHSDLLFFSTNGNMLDGKDINMSLKKFISRTNIKENITCHCFRHFLAQHLRSEGHEIGLVHKVMGWKEKGIITIYDGKASDRKYDKLKLKMCNVLG